MTKKHVKYQAYAPQEIWTERPRVISYIHQDLCGIQVEKRQDLAIEPNADLLILELKGKGLREPKVYVTNAYNAPRASEREGETAQVAMRSQILMQGCNILAGDFNLHHNDWDSHTIYPTPMSRQFADWVSESGGVYGLPSGTKTHQQGGCIDLVITSSSLSPYVYECYVDEALDVTSDHSIIITMLGIGNGRAEEDGPSKFKFQKMDDKAFFDALHTTRCTMARVGKS